jgi:hypothetical protein
MYIQYVQGLLQSRLGTTDYAPVFTSSSCYHGSSVLSLYFLYEKSNALRMSLTKQRLVENICIVVFTRCYGNVLNKPLRSTDIHSMELTKIKLPSKTIYFI